MEQNQDGFVRLSNAEQLMPQEEMLEVSVKSSKLRIGIPKERSSLERRIVLNPSSVNLLVENGHEILVETEAGKSAGFKDTDFSEAGAMIVYHPEEVFKADIILKVSPLIAEEFEYVKQRQIFISALQLHSQHKEYFQQLMQKKATAIAFEKIQTREGVFPLIRAMSEIVGNAVILIAADYLRNQEYGNGKMFGGFPGITPTQVMILGAGTVAEHAARTAIGMGAQVKIFDSSVDALRRLQKKLNYHVYTSVILDNELKSAMQGADVVIGAIHAADKQSPCMITEDMVRTMKEGSIIIDVSIDQGGCFETSRLTDHENPVFEKFGVLHYCVPNIASMVPVTASAAISNFLCPFLLQFGESGSIERLIRDNKGFSKGVYMYNGILTNRHIAGLFDLSYKDLDLLMAAFH